MTFYADENVSDKLARLLEVFDRRNEIRHITDRYEKGTPDEIWIPGFASLSPTPVILGGDGQILRRKAQRTLLRDSNLSFVYLAKGWMNIPFEQQAWKIVKAWPDIVRNVEAASTNLRK